MNEDDMSHYPNLPQSEEDLMKNPAERRVRINLLGLQEAIVEFLFTMADWMEFEAPTTEGGKSVIRAVDKLRTELGSSEQYHESLMERLYQLEQQKKGKAA